MQVAVIGTGIAGLTAAYALRNTHDLTIYEADAKPGGHSNTVEHWEGTRKLGLDTGFLVHNERNYPNLTRLFTQLGVATQDSDMSFSVHCHRCNLEYSGGSLAGLFAQRRNWVNPSFYRMVKDILHFFRHSPQVIDNPALFSLRLSEYVAREGYSSQFLHHFLLPWTAAIWSTPPRDVLNMPIGFCVAFFKNHGLLELRDAPMWKTVTGGSIAYVRKMIEAIGPHFLFDTPVLGIRRTADAVEVIDTTGNVQAFDRVVIAAHADQALRMLDTPTPREKDLLGQFSYAHNKTVLHTDATALPTARAARAAWNYEIDDCTSSNAAVAVTYSLNRLQKLNTPLEYCVSLNRPFPHDELSTLATFDYKHPIFNLDTWQAQKVLTELNGHDRLYFCGSYFGHGFHEDAMVSGLRVAEQLGGSL